MLEKKLFLYLPFLSHYLIFFFFFTVSRRMENYISGLESVKSFSHYRVLNKVGSYKSSASEKGLVMAASRGKFVLFINLLSIIHASQLETIHFTNSAKKILKANNFTTYKVDVPNGEPITIIEANMPLYDKKIKFDDLEPAQYSIKHNQYHDNDDSNRKYNKPVMDLETSLSMTVTPNNYNDEYENPATSLGEESVKNDYSNLSPEQQSYQNTRKTVYSPELLQKFLKDYANKIQMATVTSLSSTASHEPLGNFIY